MNKITSKMGNTAKRLTVFFGLPLIFAFFTYFLIYLLANPVIAPAASLLSMLVGDSVPTFGSVQVSDETVDLVDFNEEQKEIITPDRIDFPNVGDKYAHILIPDTGVDYDVYYGDDNKILRKGPGQYEASKMPGFGSTTIVAAHVTTHFKGLQYVKIGDPIYYTTTYGAYEYRVTDIQIVEATEAGKLYDLRADHDNLVLYTCYPFSSVAFRSQRYFVLAELVSGPEVQVYVD